MTAQAFQNVQTFADVEQALTLGLIGDGVTGYGRAVGYVATSDTNNHAVRGTAYTAQGAQAQRSVSSSNANDTAAGTGARSIRINYLDSAFAYHSEDVVMNGTTPVATVGTDIQYIDSIQVLTVGSGQINQGVISLFVNNSGGGGTIASCAIGDQGTAWAAHYVPAGMTCFIMNLTAGGTVVAGVANLIHQTNLQVANGPTLQIGSPVVHPGGGQWDHEFSIWLPVVGPDLVSINVQPVAATASKCWAAFEYVQGPS